MTLLETLIDYHGRGVTGSLHLQEGHTEKVIIFNKGKITHVKSDVRSEALGSLLVKKGFITNDQLRSALKEMCDTKKMLGDTLISQNLISPTQVFECLNEQMGEKLKAALQFNADTVVFTEKLPDNITHFMVPFHRTILDGIYEYYSPERFKEEGMFGVNNIISITEEAKSLVSELSLRQEENKTFLNLNKPTSLKALLDTAKSKRRTVALIFFLHKLDVLKVEKTGKNEEIDSVFKQAIKHEKKNPDGPKVQVPKTKQPANPNTGHSRTDRMYARYLRLQNMTHYERLGVDKSTTLALIERSYNEVVHKYDLLYVEQHYIEEHCENARQMYEMLTHSYMVLKDNKTREAYDKQSYQDQKTGGPPEDERLKAEMFMIKAESFLNAGEIYRALDAAKDALRIAPDNPDYLVCLADIELKIEMKTEKSILKSLQKAIEINPKHAKAHLIMAYYYKYQGKKEKAAEHFGNALELNPKCKEAETELRLLGMRQAKANKGLFSSMLGKK